MLENVKKFFKENGFSSLLVLVLAVALLFLGWVKIAILLLGIFLGRNWEILKKVYNENLKSKVDGVVSDAVKTVENEVKSKL